MSPSTQAVTVDIAALALGVHRPVLSHRWNDDQNVPAVSRFRASVFARSGQSQALRLVRVALDDCDWVAMAAASDSVVFQSREWLEFLAQTQGAEPVVASVMRGDEQVGWFTGAIVRRFGVRILGSPFAGWTTTWMGFNLDDGVDRWDACAALAPFAFGDLRCLHLELRDRQLVTPAPPSLGWAQSEPDTYLVDLAVPEDEVFGRMSSACRRAVRKAEKSGVVVELASGEDFAHEYYDQLRDVFAKQSLEPTYGVDRVVQLIRHLEPAGSVLLLRARSADGDSIATGIFPGGNGSAYFWGGASWRQHQGLRPNEAIFWHAMKCWKARGATVLEMGGGGDYKLRYGPREVTIPSFRRSRLPGMLALRDAAERVKRRGY